MSADRGGLLSSRAEEFARHLRRRLRSLGASEDDGGGPWTEARPTDTEVYYDVSPVASPEEELPEPLFIAALNRDTLPLQRSESSSSEYFDTLQELSKTPPSATTSVQKKIPILHLKTEKPKSLTNGHTNVINADLGCSRVHLIPSEEEEPCTSKLSPPVNENCDNLAVENNNTWKDMEDVVEKIDKLDLEPVLTHCNGDAVSLETECGIYTTEPLAEDKEAKETLGNTNCVFCDIEQAKSSFTNGSTEPLVLQKEDQRTCTSIDNSADKEPDKQLKENSHLKIPVEPSNESLSDAEEPIPLKDLLQMLKSEISNDSTTIKDILQVLKKEISKGNDKLERNTQNSSENSSQSVHPSIEVRESTPPSTTDAEPEIKEEFDIEAKRRNFRRSSSLKCGKTPPGTPGRKKIVRFADVLGLDLADVKTFMDEVPTVPKSAYSDLHLQPDTDAFSPASRSTPVPQTRKVLVPLFQQPFLTPNFMDRVIANNVCLESASVSDMNLFAITGVVRVRNMDFHKSVYVRYSINGWRNYSDLQARYIPNSCDGFSDKFSFVLYAHTLTVGQKLEFAVRYHTAGTQFWDSNGGVNYGFECVQQPVPQPFTTPEIPPGPSEIGAAFL